jgi:hypothetical protein
VVDPAPIRLLSILSAEYGHHHWVLADLQVRRKRTDYGREGGPLREREIRSPQLLTTAAFGVTVRPACRTWPDGTDKRAEEA